MLLGNVLTMGYKSTLLSTLVTIRYNKPIDSLADFDSSGLPLVIIKGSAYLRAIESDPRLTMKQIYSRRIVIEFNQQTEAKAAEM